MPGKSRSRALTWSKEVERRARDLYRRLYPEVQRAKFLGREDYEGHTDLVGLPIHVQVKARDHTWVGKEFRNAVSANLKTPPEKMGPKPTVHLVVQDAGGPMLVVMRLLDYVQEVEHVRNAAGTGLEGDDEGGPGREDAKAHRAARQGEP